MQKLTSPDRRPATQTTFVKSIPKCAVIDPPCVSDAPTAAKELDPRSPAPTDISSRESFNLRNDHGTRLEARP